MGRAGLIGRAGPEKACLGPTVPGMLVRNVPSERSRTIRNASEQARIPVEYTLAGAAKAVGVGKTTLHTAIKRGRLSARRLEDGSYRIDGAELARVYPPVPTERSEPSPWNEAERNRTKPEGRGTGLDADAELAVLRVRLEAAEAQLARERETVDDLRRRLDGEQAERRALQLLLKPPAPEVAAPVPAPAARRFLARLLGRQ